MIRKANRGNYNSIQLHYSDGRPDGIWICRDNLEFVLSLRDLCESTRWTDGVDRAHSLKQRLLSVEEWSLVDRFRYLINRLLEDAGGDIIEDTYYWTSESDKSGTFAQYYSGYTGSFYWFNKHSQLVVRTAIVH